MSIADTIGVRPGLAGANVVWDFRQLRAVITAPDTVSIEYLLPSEAPPAAAALYPTAEVAVRKGNRYEFFRTEPTMFRSLGVWTPTTSLTSGTANPYDTRPVEITFGGQHVDTYKAVITTQTPPFLEQRAGDHKFVYDGFGQIRLPNATLGGIVRTHTTITTTDTSRVTSPSPRVVITRTDIDNYQWMSITSNVPWVTITYTGVRVTTNGQPVSTSLTREVLFRDTTVSPTGIEESQVNTDMVYPNPVSANQSVLVAGVYGDVLEAELIDASGVASTISATHVSDGLVSFPVGNVGAGVYTIRLRTPIGAIIRRLVITR